MERLKGLTLGESIEEFERHLAQRPVALNTRKAFVGDLRIFARHLLPKTAELSGSDLPLSGITTDHIKSFISAQERDSGAKNPKSVERRLTSLKVFFKWLQERGVLATDPADRIAYKPLLDPLPEYLTEDQARAIVKAARMIAVGERLEARPLTVIMLVLQTGIKKSECLALTAADIERGEQDTALIWIHYAQKHLQFKNRRLPITTECLQVIDSHIRRYTIQDKLFDCTGRNLEYMFNRKVAPLAGLDCLTFEMLRWTCAVREFRSGQFTSEQMQVKYGLSEVGWLEMQAKLERLVRSSDNA